MRMILALLFAAGLAACSSDERAEQAARIDAVNARVAMENACLQQGVRPESPNFDECMKHMAENR